MNEGFTILYVCFLETIYTGTPNAFSFIMYIRYLVVTCKTLGQLVGATDVVCFKCSIFVSVTDSEVSY